MKKINKKNLFQLFFLKIINTEKSIHSKIQKFLINNYTIDLNKILKTIKIPFRMKINS